MANEKEEKSVLNDNGKYQHADRLVFFTYGWYIYIWMVQWPNS